jgi:hypothetical protein
MDEGDDGQWIGDFHGGSRRSKSALAPRPSKMLVQLSIRHRAFAWRARPRADVSVCGPVAPHCDKNTEVISETENMKALILGYNHRETVIFFLAKVSSSEENIKSLTATPATTISPVLLRVYHSIQATRPA